MAEEISSPGYEDIKIENVESAPENESVKDGLATGDLEIQVTDSNKVSDKDPEGVQSDIDAAVKDLEQKETEGTLTDLAGMPEDVTSATVSQVFDISIVDTQTNEQLDSSETKGSYTITLNLTLDPGTELLYHDVDGTWHRVDYTVVDGGIQFTIESFSAFAVIKINTESSEPSDEPTDQPTDEPTDQPTDEPTDQPTDEPVKEPTGKPSNPNGNGSKPTTSTTDKKPSSTSTTSSTSSVNTGVESNIALFAGAGIATLLGIAILLKARRSVAK